MAAKTSMRASGRGLAIILALTFPTMAAIAASGPSVADPARPAADVAADANRNPAALLTLAGIKPGWKMADLMQGSGYFTRLFLAEAGPKGKVYDWSPPEFIQAKKALYGDSWICWRRRIQARSCPCGPHSPSCRSRSRSTNVRTPRSSFATVHRSPLGLAATTSSALATSMPISIRTLQRENVALGPSL